ncbi:GMC family oxidoreductase [Rhizobium leguminosarum]|uniref:GMC family oxidoreductase n=1 Tax=Rhizobium leguminosarum TaxID=384 RepID=UPI001C9701F6|nr:GMC family oxidoreductase N-terminal domain-containing protein [Rhizobium leguminosarum]MBY5827931.1 FAD-binding protein [Rhizobium leguminosarum]
MARSDEASESFDYIIIGAGTAGSIIASRLGEDPSLSICVIEAGPSDLRPYVHLPAGFTKTLTQDAVTWQFKTEPTENTGGRRISATQGRVVGGSGSINGLMYNRGQPQDYDHWAQLGNRGWGYSDVLPYFKRSEARIGDADDAVRGRNGPVPVTDMDWIHPVSEAFIATAMKRGLPRNPDYNSGDQEGVGYFQRYIKKGLRVSTAAAFLRPALKRGNIKLITNARVTSLVIEGGVAQGARFVRSRGGAEATVRARREVVVCSGTVNTARLLHVSGIGPGDLLNELGVDVVRELRGVGENLIDHYSARAVMRAKPDVVTLNEMARGPRLVWQVLRWLARRPNILALSPSQVFLFLKSNRSLDLPDLQCVFTPGSYKEGKHYVLDSYPGVTAGAWQHRPLSKGYVRAVSKDAWVDPVIQPNYLDHPTDQQVMVRGVQMIRELLHAPELSKFLVEETVPGPRVKTDEDMLDFVKRNGSTGYHLVGTARMGGASDPLAVVDDQLRVHGIERLRIADASIMPMIPSANTYAASMMIGEKAADLIRGKLAASV